MTKAIAKLEGLNPVEYRGEIMVFDRAYNPFVDGRTSRKLILKYKVNVIKYHHSVTIVKDNGGFGLKCTRATYNTDDDLPYAVVECILKANGLWITNNK